MRTTPRLLVIVGVASLMTTVLSWGLVLALFPLLQKPNLPMLVQVPTLAVIMLTPAALGAFWVFRKLRPHWPTRKARAVATAFGVFTPMSFCVASTLSTVVGGYSEWLAGYPFFGFAGAFVGVVTITWLLSFAACTFALWVAHLEHRAH